MTRPRLTTAELDALEGALNDLDVSPLEGGLLDPLVPLAASALALIEEVRDRRTSPRAVPRQLRSLRYSPRLGPIRVYVDVDVDLERIVGTHVDVELSQGTHLVESGRAYARLATRALRAGAALADVVEDLVGTAGGPEGAVRDCDGVTAATSLPELLGLVLEVAQRDVEGQR